MGWWFKPCLVFLSICSVLTCSFFAFLIVSLLAFVVTCFQFDFQIETWKRNVRRLRPHAAWIIFTLHSWRWDTKSLEIMQLQIHTHQHFGFIGQHTCFFDVFVAILSIWMQDPDIDIVAPMYQTFLDSFFFGTLFRSIGFIGILPKNHVEECGMMERYWRLAWNYVCSDVLGRPQWRFKHWLYHEAEEHCFYVETLYRRFWNHWLHLYLTPSKRPYHVFLKFYNSNPSPGGNFAKLKLAVETLMKEHPERKLVFLIDPKGECGPGEWKAGAFALCDELKWPVLIGGPHYPTHQVLIQGIHLPIYDTNDNKNTRLIQARDECSQIVPFYPELGNPKPQNWVFTENTNDFDYLFPIDLPLFTTWFFLLSLPGMVSQLSGLTIGWSVLTWMVYVVHHFYRHTYSLWEDLLNWMGKVELFWLFVWDARAIWITNSILSLHFQFAFMLGMGHLVTLWMKIQDSCYSSTGKIRSPRFIRAQTMFNIVASMFLLFLLYS